MRRAVHALVVVLAVLMLVSACGGSSVKIATGAARQGAGALGHSTVTVEASSDDVARLAEKVHVDDDVIRDIAPSLDTQPTWRTSVNGVRTVYDQVPEAVQEVLLGLACDGVNGKIRSTDDLVASLQIKLAEYPIDDRIQFRMSVESLWRDLYKASISGNPDVRASAALSCFTIEQVLSLS